MTALHEACRAGDLDLVKRLLSDNPYAVHARAENGLMPLHCATEHLPVVQYLCAQTSDRDRLFHRRQDRQGRTLLHHAILGGHVPVVEWFVEKDNEEILRRLQMPVESRPRLGYRRLLDAIDRRSETVLHYAARRRADLPLVQYLVQVAHSNLMGRNWNGKTALDVAVDEGNTRVASYLQPMKDLFFASHNGDHDEMMRLCQAGVFGGFRINNRGETLLHSACIRGDARAARILHHEANVNINSVSDDGTSPLIYASGTGETIIIRWLCEQGATVNLATLLELSTPLCRAVYRGHYDVARVLLEFGADPNHSVYHHGQSPLHIACREGDLPLVRLLLEHSAQTELRDESGNLPLHSACRGGHVHAVHHLIAHGNVRVEGNDWIRAVQIASDRCHFELLQLFVVHRIIQRL